MSRCRARLLLMLLRWLYGGGPPAVTSTATDDDELARSFQKWLNDNCTASSATAPRIHDHDDGSAGQEIAAARLPDHPDVILLDRPNAKLEGGNSPFSSKKPAGCSADTQRAPPARPEQPPLRTWDAQCRWRRVACPRSARAPPRLCRCAPERGPRAWWHDPAGICVRPQLRGQSRRGLASPSSET